MDRNIEFGKSWRYKQRMNPIRDILSAVLMAVTIMLTTTGPSFAGGTDSRIVHVVLVWLKDPGNAAHRAKIVEATRSFSAIPGVEEIRTGRPVPAERPTADDSFDVGLYIIFASKDALDAYSTHPLHKAAEQTVLRPLVARVVVYDFRDDAR